jgi:acetyl-CoA hydrolase
VPPVIRADALDLGEWIRPADLVVCAQAGAEPLSLTRRLVAQRAGLGGGVRVFLGAMFADTFGPAHCDHLSFVSYGAMGSTVPLAQAGRLAVMPCHYSELDAAFESGRWQADVVLLQLSPGLDGGPPSLGLGNDYAAAAARRARVVIAEINPDAPWTFGAELPADLRIDLMVQADTAPVPIAASTFGEVESRIAARVAAIVPDRATIQTGIGALPDAVLGGLSGHRDLGLHTGLMGDGAALLIEGGAVTNAFKAIDRGVSVTNVVCGSPRLHRLLHRHPAVSVRRGAYTHGARTLMQIPDLFAINSALEVDLTGQVNAETLGRSLRGGVGGANDFARAARGSAHGRSITVLPSTTQGGRRSRIVPALSGGVVTITRSDADLIVTEHGVADLRHCTLDERAQRLIAIADPRFREALQRALADPASWMDNGA